MHCVFAQVQEEGDEGAEVGEQGGVPAIDVPMIEDVGRMVLEGLESGDLRLRLRLPTRDPGGSLTSPTKSALPGVRIATRLSRR